MRVQRLWLLALPALALPALMFTDATGPGLAQQPKSDAAAKAAIHANAEGFVEAFHKGDAKAVASFWTADGDLTDSSGRTLKGREAIQKAFTNLFAENKGLKLQVEGESLRFVTPDVAIEEGTTAVIPADGPPNRARYTIIHVKKDGQWFVSSLRNSPYAQASNGENLAALDWLIGDWAGETSTGEAEHLSFTWAENQSFIIGSFSTTARKASVGSAKQWIGWDPLAKNVRSWVFDTTGAFGEGSWAQEGKKWVVKTSVVLPEGKKATATFILSPVDADTIALQSRDRTVDGNKLPDTKELKLKRVK